MPRQLCQRCLQVNGPSARFCRMCGCRFTQPQEPPTPPHHSSSSCVIAWILAAVFTFALLHGDQSKARSAAVTELVGGSTGLIFDLPPDYAQGHFRPILDQD